MAEARQQLADELFGGTPAEQGLAAELFPEQVAQPSLMTGGPPKTLLEEAGEAAASLGKRAVLPTIGSVAGQAIGQHYGGEPGRQLGGAAGSVLGTGANMALGLEQPSLENLGVAAATPALGRGTTAGAARLLPGSGVSRLQEITGQVKDMANTIRGGVTHETVTDLFSQAAQHNPKIELYHTGFLARSVARREQEALPGLKFGGVNKVAQELIELSRVAPAQEVREMVLSPLVDEFGREIFSEQVVRFIPEKDGKVPLAILDLQRQRIGGMIGAATNDATKGEWKALYKGIMQDIEAAADRGVAGADTLRQGIKAQRRLYAADDWDDEVQQAIGRQRPGDNLQPVNTGKLLREVQRMREGHPSTRFELFAGSISKDELQDMEELLTRMNRQNVRLMPVQGAMFGAGQGLMRAGLVAGGLKLAGVDPATAGAIGAVTPFAGHALSRLLLTPLGRNLLHHALDTGNVLDPIQIAGEFMMQSARGGVESLRNPPSLQSTPTPEARISSP